MAASPGRSFALRIDAVLLPGRTLSMVAVRIAFPCPGSLYDGISDQCEVGNSFLQPGAYIGPAALLFFCYFAALPQVTPYTLIWLAHIGFDRALGFGLKYPTHFKDTHLQHV